MPLRFSLAAALLLAACGPDAPAPDSPAGPAPAVADDGSPPDTAMVRQATVESTRDLLDLGVDRASPSVAIQTIDLWIARLDTTAVDSTVADGALADVSRDLTQLRNLLQSSPLDGPAIGRTLRDLGDQTADLAPAGTPAADLARVLRAQGLRLAPDTTSVEE